MQPDNESLINAAADYLWSDELQREFDAFAAEHAHMFVGADAEGEQRLEWEEVYHAFRCMYEAQLEHFLAHHAVEMGTFAAACQDALDNSSWQDSKGLVEVVLAMCEYPFFISMMADAAEALAGDPAERPDLAAEGGPGAPPRRHEEEEDLSDFM